MAGLKGGPSGGAGGAAAGGLLGGAVGDVNSMLGGLGLSGLVGQDQAGMRNAGLAAGLGQIGQGLMQGGASGGLYDSTGMANPVDTMQAAMLRYGMDPSRQAASQQAINQIPGGLQANGLGTGGQSSWSPPQNPMAGIASMFGGMGGASAPEYDFTPQAMPGGGGMGGGGGSGFAGAGMAGRPGGGSSILDFLSMMGNRF